jgi:hypothetical protein
MTDVTVRSDSVDVEQIMRQIRQRIREKRGADYTQAELQQLASAKLEQFADPSGLRSDLLEEFRKKGDEPSTYHRHRGVRRWMLMMAHPLLKRVQKQLMSDLNLYFEIIHNLVIETTRLGIENHNLKMKVESLSSRLDFDERRAKALEGVVQYRRDALPRHKAGTSGTTGTTGTRNGLTLANLFNFRKDASHHPPSHQVLGVPVVPDVPLVPVQAFPPALVQLVMAPGGAREY